MKKALLLLCSLFVMNAQAQNPNYKEKLFYTCKLWGFVKYFHSGVSTCQVNWDSVLVSRLPHIKNAVTTNDFNNELDTLLQMAGPMAIAVSPPPAPVAPELSRNLDFNWINHSILRNDIKGILDTIKNNFRPHASCWVKDKLTPNGLSWLRLPYDSLMYNANAWTNFPNEYTRLLIGFKYWNILSYFNPYNYVMDQPCDSILSTKILLFANAANGKDLYYAIERMSRDLNDAHAEDYTWNTNTTAPSYYYLPPLRITHTQNKYIVVKSGIAAIKRGDEIVSVNGVAPAVMVDSLRPYVSAGDSGVFYRFMSMYMFTGNINTPVSIGYKDSIGNSYISNTSRTSNLASSFYQGYYPNDTLGTVTWKKIGCNLGYVNMGKLQQAHVSTMYNNLKNTDAIIFDLRNYPYETAWPIADAMFATKTHFATLMNPDVNYPGTYFLDHDSIGIPGNVTPYQGKLIILINEETQSQAEYSCMMFEAMPDVVKVGSQTAGADGDVTYFFPSKDTRTTFSSRGVFYPNGDSTQRIGIVPDSVVHQTQLGIRHKRDEVLEKALQIAGCSVVTAIEKNSSKEGSVIIFPNPAESLITVQTTHTSAKMDYAITDVLGKIIVQHQNNHNNFTVDISGLVPGIYFMRLLINDRLEVKKFVKE